MKITGKKSISTLIKIFLIILFIICLIAMVSFPMVAIIYVTVEVVFLYIAAIPALLMIIEFIKIFSSLEKGKVFDRKIEKGLKRAAIDSFLIGFIFLSNIIIYVALTSFEELLIEPIKLIYLIYVIFMSMIFSILSVGLIVLKNIYRTAIDNKEENDLTI